MADAMITHAANAWRGGPGACGKWPSKLVRNGAWGPRRNAIIRKMSSLRNGVEHLLRVMQRRFGYTKTRYRGLAKNAAQLVILIELTNLYLQRHAMIPDGRGAPGIRPNRRIRTDIATVSKNFRYPAPCFKA